MRMPGLQPTQRLQRLAGQAMVEYLIILPVLLMLVLGGIQFALLYQIKSTLNYAAFMGARQGALQNANILLIKDGVAAGMTPLFTFSPDILGLLKGRSIAMIEIFNPLTTRVEVLSPTSRAADDFAIDDPDDERKRIIPNDNLMYRCGNEEQAPCDQPVGENSGLTIQDANLLKIRVTYCAKLVVPLANVTIYSLINGIEGAKNLAGTFFSTQPRTATTPNMCSRLKDRLGEKVDAVVDAGRYVGADLSFMQSMLNRVSSALSNARVPLLDWGIGGYRIPVTADAVIRMQSPARFKQPPQ